MCKPLPMFSVDNNAHFHSAWPRLMPSRILYCSSLLFMFRWDLLPSRISSNIYVYIGSSSDSFLDESSSISSSLINDGRVESSSEFYRFPRRHKFQITNSESQTIHFPLQTWLYSHFFPLEMYHKVFMIQPVA